MGCRNRDSITENHTSSSSSSSDSLSEALLFTTMCIVGHPVDVHVKDGSVYSGIFHTASVHADYGSLPFSLVDFFTLLFSEKFGFFFFFVDSLVGSKGL